PPRARDAQLAGADLRAVEPAVGLGDPDGSGPLLHRAGGADPGARVGRHGRDRRRAHHRGGLVGVVLSRPLHRPGRDGVQPHRGRAPGPSGSPATLTVLEVQDLTVTFHTGRGTVTAIHGVDLTLPTGRVTGLVGESGCGKTV